MSQQCAFIAGFSVLFQYRNTLSLMYISSNFWSDKFFEGQFSVYLWFKGGLVASMIGVTMYFRCAFGANIFKINLDDCNK